LTAKPASLKVVSKATPPVFFQRYLRFVEDSRLLLSEMHRLQGADFKNSRCKPARNGGMFMLPGFDGETGGVE
jgi:hypothetical protein